MKVVVSVGGTWHAPHLCYQLQRREMLSAVFTTTPKGRFCHRADVDADRLHWVPMPELFGGHLPRLLKIPPSFYSGAPYLHAVTFDKYVARAVRSLDLDLLLAFAWYGLESCRVAKSRGIPALIERGSSHAVFREQLLLEEYERLQLKPPQVPGQGRIRERELLEYELADYIVVPSRFAEESFIQAGIAPEKLLRIPYGVDLARFSPAESSGDSVFRILSVGNLGVEKGTVYLLEAVSLLKGLNLELCLIGTVDPFIQSRLSELSIPWTFLGPRPQTELTHLYNASAVYCLLSIQEGMSMTILEAMACGLPVIASANTGAADVVNDEVDGFVVSVRDPEIVADRLLFLYNHLEARREMARRARDRVSSFSWDDYGERVADAYRRVSRTVVNA